MKTNMQKATLFTTLMAAGLLLAASPAQAVNYAGNGNAGFGGGGHIGNGALSVTDDGTNLTFTITPNGGNLGGNALALYIDTGAAGFASTASFNDNGDGGRTSISGYNNSSQYSVMTFTNGFRPSYAISFSDSYTSLFGLANGGANSFNWITGTGSSTYSFTINCAQIGLATNVSTTIRIFGSFISEGAYRSNEAIAGNDSSLIGQGWNAWSQTAFASYNFAAPPAPSFPVTFQVDMTVQIASGAFNPVNGDTVYATGTFQTNVWSAQVFQLTSTVANTNIYTGTYLDYNPTNTPEQFKFDFVSVGNASTNFESLDNRPFTLRSPGVTNALVYFDDVFPTNTGPNHVNLSFSIDLTAQIDLGNFNPLSGDQIEVLGTFENPKWTTGGLILTQTLGNTYTGTITDTNYPGTFENYKFVIVKTSGNTFESGNNRDFFTPTNSYTFPIAYFNGLVSLYSEPVSFQVDMTVPILTGQFNVGNGDIVYAAGTFQTNGWNIGTFQLTNNPSAANTNIYSGTYVSPDAPGTGEQFLFVIVSGGNNIYESVPNRTFIMSSPFTAVPLVQWSNDDTNNVLLSPTAVTFTVNMTNAVDIYGGPFVPGSDVVIINGYFTTPTGSFYSWTDATLGVDYPQYQLFNDPIGSAFYTGTYTIPAGSSLAVTYKYGIIHNYTINGNTNADLEAGFALNHTRYIRTTGTYTFPVDIFGIQQTNLPAATEQPIMNLSIGTPTSGQLPITWLGLPGTHLQYTTNLINSVWVDLNATTGASATNWPQTNASAFFRVVLP